MQRFPGLHPRHFPRPLRELVECDYAHLLGDKDKAWLAKFNDEFAAGCFRARPLHRRKKQRREIWREVKQAKQDALALAKVGGILLYPDATREDAGCTEGDGWEALPAPERDWRQPVEDEVHAAAVRELRRSLPRLPSDSRSVVRASRAHAAAVARVVAVNRAQQSGPQPQGDAWADPRRQQHPPKRRRRRQASRSSRAPVRKRGR